MNAFKGALESPGMISLSRFGPVSLAHSHPFPPAPRKGPTRSERASARARTRSPNGRRSASEGSQSMQKSEVAKKEPKTSGKRGGFGVATSEVIPLLGSLGVGTTFRV